MYVVTKLPGRGVDLSRSISQLVLVLAEVWAQELARRPLPSLYSSGVVYRAESPHNLAEEWTDPYTTHERKYGDCDDLVIWRLAEILNEAGYKGDRKNLPAWPAVARRVDSPEYHVMIRYRNGELEDPAKKLLPKGGKLS